MTAVREQILAEVTTRLETVTGLTVFRTPETEIDESQFPAAAVFGGDHETNSQDANLALTYQMSVLVELYVQANTGPELEPAYHALYASVIAALMTDTTLGGLAHWFVEFGMTVERNYIDGQGPTIAGQINFSTLFSTAYNNVEQPAPL